MRTRRLRILGAIIALGLMAAPAGAADLVIGVGSEATTLDPHFYNLGPNTEITETVFDRLVHHDENYNATPGLAESWSVVRPGRLCSSTSRSVLFFSRVPATSSPRIVS